MNDLLWLADHPLWGTIMGISTSQNPDTPEGLEGRLSGGIRRILAELPHSIELELRKPHWSRLDSGKVLMFLMQLHKRTELSMSHFIGSILQVLYLYFPKGGRISVMSKTNTESNSNEYY
jgi:hypothetical protein